MRWPAPFRTPCTSCRALIGTRDSLLHRPARVAEHRWRRGCRCLSSGFTGGVQEARKAHAYTYVPRKLKKNWGEGRRLQFGAGVRIDLTVQANFLKSWCCPLHIFPPYSPFKAVCLEREM